MMPLCPTASLLTWVGQARLPPAAGTTTTTGGGGCFISTAANGSAMGMLHVLILGLIGAAFVAAVRMKIAE